MTEFCHCSKALSTPIIDAARERMDEFGQAIWDVSTTKSGWLAESMRMIFRFMATLGGPRGTIRLVPILRCAFVIIWGALGFFEFSSIAIQTAFAADGRRVALVIGNSDYQHVGRLGNPGNDARLISQTLSHLGFTIIGGGAQLNVGKSNLDRLVQGFGQEIQRADVALFYYSGHGLQVQGENWLVPVDANPTRPQDLDFQMVSADLVLKQMQGAGTRLNILILDACRNNPFGSRNLRGAVGGLAQMTAPDGTIISYATQPGAVAQDGTGRDSPFTTALARSMQQPGLDIFQVFNQVGLGVKQDTEGAQEPWMASSPISGDFYFSGVLPSNQAIRAQIVAPTQTGDPPRTDDTASQNSALQRRMLDREPPAGSLRNGEVVLVNDGSCPTGQVKQITGAPNRNTKRKYQCVPMN